MAKKYEHEGHRKRMQNKFSSYGFSGWSEEDILEYMLFYAIPRSDTRPLAERLIKECGTLKGVLTAPSEILQNVDGVGKSTAAFIKSLGEFTHYCGEVRSNGKVYLTPSLCDVYFRNMFKSHNRESLYMVCVDARRAVIARELISEGSVDTSEVDIGRVVRIAVRNDAAGVILAHNHPGGNLEPSGADIITTQMVRQALKLVGIVLEEHIIVTEEGAKGFINIIKDIETEKNIQKYMPNR